MSDLARLAFALCNGIADDVYANLQDAFLRSVEATISKSTMARSEFVSALWERMQELPHQLDRAQVYVWEESIWRAAISGHESFIGLTLEDASIPKRTVFHFITDGVGGSPILVYPTLYPGDIKAIEGFYFEAIPGMPGRTLPIVNPTTYIGEPIPPAWSEVVAMHHFCAQPFVESTEANGFESRQQARSFERKTGKLPDIRIVTVRKKAQEDHESTSSREYSCQWLVSGHWRKRTRGEGPPIYVRPHVKGPPGKPLRAPRPTVYEVRR